jgi:hypothetical protein
MDQRELSVRLLLAAGEYWLKADRREAKANFNPAQPRAPKGGPDGGEWVRVSGWSKRRAKELTDSRGFLSEQDIEDLDVAMRAQTREVQQFIERNRRTINRTVGALQMLGGGGEMIAGVAGVGGGVATSETGVGIAIAGASAWMVANGYDNFTTGWRALLTGNPQQTNRQDQATATEILLAGGVSAGAARLTRARLLEAAERGLAQRALAQFAAEPLNVRAGALRVWDEINIHIRGEAWEAFDAQRTGFLRAPSTFPVFDQANEAFDVAISNKTLDLALAGYSRVDRSAVYNTVAGYIDRVAAFREGKIGNFLISGSRLRQRRLHLLLPSGEVLPGQALQVAAAEQYAAQRGVILQVEYAR